MWLVATILGVKIAWLPLQKVLLALEQGLSDLPKVIQPVKSRIKEGKCWEGVPFVAALFPVYSEHPSSRWCHPTSSSSVVPFSSCLQSFPASGSFPGIQAQDYCFSPFPIVAWSPGTSPLYSSLVLPAASSAAHCEGFTMKVLSTSMDTLVYFPSILRKRAINLVS